MKTRSEFFLVVPLFVFLFVRFVCLYVCNVVPRAPSCVSCDSWFGFHKANHESHETHEKEHETESLEFSDNFVASRPTHCLEFSNNFVASCPTHCAVRTAYLERPYSRSSQRREDSAPKRAMRRR